MKQKRCEWAKNKPKYYQEYHDKEWGVPQHNDNLLFELLILEGAQAGLSWSTVLKKRQNYRKAFDKFNPKKVAKYDENKVQELLQNEGIIRNKLKVRSAIRNAKIFLEIQKEFKTFDNYIWAFANHKPLNPKFKTIKEIPTKTPLAEEISKDLKKRGMNFIGPTIIYAFIQAIGLTNDHTACCFKYQSLN